MKLKRKARRNISTALAKVTTAIDQVHQLTSEAGKPKLAAELSDLGYAAVDKMARKAKIKKAVRRAWRDWHF